MTFQNQSRMTLNSPRVAIRLRRPLTCTTLRLVGWTSMVRIFSLLYLRENMAEHPAMHIPEYPATQCSIWQLSPSSSQEVVSSVNFQWCCLPVTVSKIR